MEDNYINTLPHGNDLDAVSGYEYVGESDEVLSLWNEIVKNNSIHTGTNFDLSDKLELLDKSRRLRLLYDFLHRVMIYYDEPNESTCAKRLTLKEFRKYIGV